MSDDRRSVLCSIAADCHRTKWQFDDSNGRLSANEARRLVRRAFDELHRIGDVALKAYKAVNQDDAGGDELLYRLIDWTYLYALEGQAWPDHATISDHLIALAKSRDPGQGDAETLKAGASLKSLTSKERGDV